MIKLCVIGNPIENSQSPWIHQQFAKQTGIIIEYKKCKVKLDQFKQTVFDFKNAGGYGLNITAPFKQQAFMICDQVSERAKMAAAVNTITFTNEKIIGDNTDGIGLVRDIMQNLHFSLENKAILILGAGGAARGIIPALLQEHPKILTIYNRTIEKAQKLAKDFHMLGNIHSDESLTGKKFDVVIDATTASDEKLLTSVQFQLNSASLCYDLKYHQNKTPFMYWAEKQKADIIANGLGMLVEQAAESFYIWTGKKPKTKEIVASVKHSVTEGNKTIF